jgi:hypothetical protein
MGIIAAGFRGEYLRQYFIQSAARNFARRQLKVNATPDELLRTYFYGVKISSLLKVS